MRVISDLTKDTRQPLKDILIETIYDVIKIDVGRPNDDVKMVEYENKTFYYRVIFLFLQRVVSDYSDKEIENWCKRELLHEAVLPEIRGYGKDDLA